METRVEKQLLSDVKDIKECLLGKPLYEKTGLVHDFHLLKKEVDEIKNRGVKMRWFGRGVSAAVGAGAYGTVKSSWFAKLVGTLFGTGAAEKMIK